MFDRIFDFIESVWEWLIPWVILDPYEEGVVIRLGNFNRVIGPGIHWMWPVGIEACKYETVVRQTSYLDVQSLTSKDGKPVTISAILVYIIDDIRKFLLDIDDGETDLQNMCYGVIGDCVEDTNWIKIKINDFNNRVLRRCRHVSETYCGVKLLDVKYSDKSTARNIRLWND